MHDVDFQDAGLVEESNVFNAHFTSYRSWCEVFNQPDVSESFMSLNRDVRPKAIYAKQQWRKSLGRLSLSIAYSKVGLLTKGKILQDYFTECPAEDIEARMLMTSFFADLGHFLGESNSGC